MLLLHLKQKFIGNLPQMRAVWRCSPCPSPFGIVLSLKQREIIPIDMEGSYYLKKIPVLCCKKSIGSDEVASRLLNC